MRNLITKDLDFPQQRISGSKKKSAEWYAACIDYVIAAGIAMNDRGATGDLIRILHGDIPDEFYKKTLNPYNSNNERYTRFPATMRNLDIMRDIVRRYVSEYFKGVHEFMVSANSPDIVLKKNAKLNEAVMAACQQALKAEFEKQYNAMTQKAVQNGQNPEEINPQDAMPDVESFVAEFESKYIDDASKQAQDVLNYIRSFTDDNKIYLSAFMNYVCFGECYTYSTIAGSKINKESISVLDAYPIPNGNFFVEDHDMFARRMLLTYNQIMDMFDDVLIDKDRKFLQEHYSQSFSTGGVYAEPLRMSYTSYYNTYPDICCKFDKEERELFKQQPLRICENNNNLYEVWHTVWRGESRCGILSYVNEVGIVSTKVVEEDYELNPEAGDLSIEYTYIPQVYEGYRIGHRYAAIYPIKARPIAFERNGKLPYNGLMEVLPEYGKFSIVENVTPYQVLRNIISYHREMAVAKNKNNILLMPESLISSNSEDRVYRMAADGILMFDDSEDTNSLKAQQIRMLTAANTDYIAQLTNLLEVLKQEARETVDMSMQRYGDIAQSAGVGTTQEAIARSSMGMVILVEMFDQMRTRDYNRDIDFAKLAYCDGLDTAYYNELASRKFLSLNVNDFINSDYSTTVRNDAKELDKVQRLRDWAFSAAQNGDLDMALAAITGDNVSQIKATVEKFMENKRAYEERLEQIKQQTAQQASQIELNKIQAQGEEDRKTLTLDNQYKIEIERMKIQADLNKVDPGIDNTFANNLAATAESNKTAIANQKLELERSKLQADLYNKAADRDVKRKDIDTKLQIAKTNKNKYDK